MREASMVKEAWSHWRHFACHNQLSWSQVYCIRCIWSRWLSIRLSYQSCSTLAERVHQNSSTIKLGTEINALAFAQILHHLSCCTPYSNLYSIDGLMLRFVLNEMKFVYVSAFSIFRILCQCQGSSCPMPQSPHRYTPTCGDSASISLSFHAHRLVFGWFESPCEEDDCERLAGIWPKAFDWYLATYTSIDPKHVGKQRKETRPALFWRTCRSKQCTRHCCWPKPERRQMCAG